VAPDVPEIETVVREQHARRPFSGFVHVPVEGETLFASAFGYANRADSIPNTVSTRFGTASGTTTFTAVAICQLIEAGKITLDSRLSDFVDHPVPLFDEGITIHQLLTHTSRAPDYFDEEELGEDANFGDLFKDLRMYGITAPSDLLPLFQNETTACGWLRKPGPSRATPCQAPIQA
jgi:CubicO group peptidase (beta-lactamase class C family)